MINFFATNDIRERIDNELHGIPNSELDNEFHYQLSELLYIKINNAFKWELNNQLFHGLHVPLYYQLEPQ